MWNMFSHTTNSTTMTLHTMALGHFAPCRGSSAKRAESSGLMLRLQRRIMLMLSWKDQLQNGWQKDGQIQRPEGCGPSFGCFFKDYFFSKPKKIREELRIVFSHAFDMNVCVQKKLFTHCQKVFTSHNVLYIRNVCMIEMYTYCIYPYINSNLSNHSRNPAH